jgi:phosphoenolpyruvate-protein phosphotransferase (PTS system enzyme I)
MIGELLRGVPASPGIAVGTAFIIDTGEAAPTPNSASRTTNAAAEKSRWRAARDALAGALNQLAERARQKVGTAEAGIFEAQALMAGDPGLQEQVDAAIEAGQSAEVASQHAIDGFAAMFADIKDAYLRQRRDDVREVGRALSRALAGRPPVPLTDLPRGAVVCAAELGVGTLLMLDRASLVALVLGSGGATSHVAILARTFGVPAVLGVGDLSAIVSGMLRAVDGTSGDVQLNPQGTRLAELQDQIEAQAVERTSLARLRGEPATTTDGFRLDLWANVGNPSDVAPALEQGAEGIGLFRTEFLIVGRETLPTEDEQYRVYRQLLEGMRGSPVVIRTFDIGGDKPVPALHLPPEANPFLGVRAIRIGLARPELLATQLRAIARGRGRPTSMDHVANGELR